MSVVEVMRASRIVPVIVLDKAEDAVPLARTFLEAGIGSIEITLRTPAGMEAIRRTVGEVPGIIVGAGTVTSVEEMRAVHKAGIGFVVSPGYTPTLLFAAADLGVAYLPGVLTPSELMVASETGLSCLKFFPAEVSGGAAMLRAWSSVFPSVGMVPTGGIDTKNAADYFAVSTVAAVGCSWVAPAKMIAEHAWPAIRERCARMLALAPKI